MIPPLLRRLSLTLMSQISGMNFKFSDKDYTWEFCLEIYEFLELSRMHLPFDVIELSSNCSYIRFTIPPFEIHRKEPRRMLEPSNAMKAYYCLYLFMKENDVDDTGWRHNNFHFLINLDYHHVDRTMIYDTAVWKDNLWNRRCHETDLIVPTSLLLNKEFLEIIRLLYNDIFMQTIE